MKNISKTIWLYSVVFISIYAIDVPVIQVNAYRLILPILGVLFFCFLRKNNIESCYIGETCKYSIKQWGIIFLWGAVLTVINLDTFRNEMRNLGFILYLICAIYVFSYYFSFNECRKTIKTAFFFISIIIGLSGVYESLTGNYYHLTYESYAYTLNSFGFYRPNTIFYNVNDNAVFSLFSVVVAFLLADECKHKIIIKLLALVVFGMNIIMVDSRGAEAGLALFLALFFIKSNRIRNKPLVFIITMPAAFVMIRFLIETLDISKIFQFGDRLNVWNNSLKSLADSYCLGVGPGNISLRNSKITSSITTITAVHNFLLEILCDYGMVGFFAVMGFIVRLIKISLSGVQNSSRLLIVFSGLIAFLLSSVTGSSLMGKSWFGCFIAIIVAEINYIEIANRN